MSRINVVNHATANAEQKDLLDAIQAQLGMVPNFLKVFANSPVALRAFLGLHGVANDGSLDPQTRERIALALAQQNTCEYCLSAHTAIGAKAGLNRAEIQANREGSSQDAKAAVAVNWRNRWQSTKAKSAPPRFWKRAMPVTAMPISLKSSPTSA